MQDSEIKTSVYVEPSCLVVWPWDEAGPDHWERIVHIGTRRLALVARGESYFAGWQVFDSEGGDRVRFSGLGATRADAAIQAETCAALWLRRSYDQCRFGEGPRPWSAQPAPADVKVQTFRDWSEFACYVKDALPCETVRCTVWGPSDRQTIFGPRQEATAILTGFTADVTVTYSRTRGWSMGVLCPSLRHAAFVRPEAHHTVTVGPFPSIAALAPYLEPLRTAGAPSPC